MVSEPQLENIHILVAEDDKVMRKLLKDMLSIVGFKNTSIVSDGEEAVRVLKAAEVDLLITDWKMAPMDGLELVKFLRNSTESPNRFLPVIMLTGHGERRDVEAARDMGVTEYLVKPFTAAALFDRIKNVIAKPRHFIIAPKFKGPDRRRKRVRPPDGMEKRQNDQ